MGTEASCILTIIKTKRTDTEAKKAGRFGAEYRGRSRLFFFPETSMLGNHLLNPRKRRDCGRINKREY